MFLVSYKSENLQKFNKKQPDSYKIGLKLTVILLEFPVDNFNLNFDEYSNNYSNLVDIHVNSDFLLRTNKFYFSNHFYQLFTIFTFSTIPFLIRFPKKKFFQVNN